MINNTIWKHFRSAAALSMVALTVALIVASSREPSMGEVNQRKVETEKSEPAALLYSLAESQIVYFAKNNLWAGYPGGDRVFESLGWKPVTPNSYAYYCGNDRVLPAKGAGGFDYPNVAKDWPYGLYPEVTLADFVCMAVGNTDNDRFPDVWIVDKFKRPLHVLDDNGDKTLVDIVNEPFEAPSYFAALWEKEHPNGPTRVSIEINVAAYRADLYEDGRKLKSFSIAIGMMGYKTPVRDFYMERIEWNPWWIPPDAPWCRQKDEEGNDQRCSPQGPGPGNPLGPVKMVLQNSILMHGTNKPNSIGHKASHSCMRMRSDDATELAWKVMILAGTRGAIVPRELYRDKSRRTYRLALLSDVQVTTAYRRMEVHDGLFILNTDPYIRQALSQNDIRDKVKELGLPESVSQNEALYSPKMTDSVKIQLLP